MPTRNLPSDPSLEHLRNEASQLQRAVRAGEPQATALARELHPYSPAADAFTRADAQLVVARRYGFPSWPKLRHHVEVVGRYSRAPHRQEVGRPIGSESELVDEFLRLACLTYGSDDPARPRQAREMLAERPVLASATIHTIAAVGDVAAARALLSSDPSQASLEGGPYAWEPLLYLAYSRIDSARPGHSTLEVARLLLEHGADPNAGYLWEGLPSPFTALTGAFGHGEGDPPPHQYAIALARLLLEAGADPNDSQTVYNRSFVPQDDYLELLLAFGFGKGSGGVWHERLAPAHPAPARMAEDALVWAVLRDFAARVALLLRHGVDPDGRGTNHPVVGGHRPYELGVVRGNVEIADLLLAAGADRTLDPVMAFAGACARADRAEVERLLGDDPALVQRAMRREPQLMVTAVEQRRRDAVRLLAEVGFDVNLMPRGAPLHEAAYMGDLELVELLLELGADPELRDRSYDSTPLGWAEYNGQEEVAEFLRRSSTSTRTT